MEQRRTQVQFSLSFAVYSAAKSDVFNAESHWGHRYFSDCASFSYYINWAKPVKWLLWENVEHSNFNCWLRKGYQLLMSQKDFFFYKMQIFFGSILLCFEQSSLLLNCITLYILFVFLNMFCVLFVCTFTHCLFVFFDFFFPPMCFCSVKLPEKQFYSMNIKPLLEDSINLFHYLRHLCLFYHQCQGMCMFMCLSFLITGHPC